jgi:hypothetical protein
MSKYILIICALLCLAALHLVFGDYVRKMERRANRNRNRK